MDRRRDIVVGASAGGVETLMRLVRGLPVLAREGNDSNFGARPLRRTVQRSVENPISRELLAGGYQAIESAGRAAAPAGT